ncbi:NAD-glutamate dehydrogenase domain-containing protein [Nitratiruptor sp. YY09-18]|uniref:NAD-glutamate dehydrogenase domain-containing protein n=1 Tax=Nitratiruptor sp. YY09-18 TaxID=2724901 RepID=UPI001914EB4C|nr:NAD-glutamate dehydrogenase domain-containing protein [Nitratiruptor sp. YY09-18]BCD68764.1 glutamate dehydrogenase [Nitratiruptor sp. YY09-18]
MELNCADAVTSEDRQIASNIESVDLAIQFAPTTTLTLYSKEDFNLSDIILLLHNFDIAVKDNITAQIGDIYINKMVILAPSKELEKNQKIFKEIFLQAISGKILHKCSLYALAISEGIGLEQIIFLRAMVKYMGQLVGGKKEESIVKLLKIHHPFAKLLCENFFSKKSSESMTQYLEGVENFEEYKLLHLLSEVVRNITRSNFSMQKETKSFKFAVDRFKHLLDDLNPNIEIFVYHKDFLGVHLRIDKVSRGGIRWSDREDFRQEIKSLMVTQEMKNAIIVPAGGKGGIYIEKSVDKATFTHYYSLYIDAMLDLINKKPTKKGDFYFVVAADKGTSDMSDVANTIAIKKGYWLRDAFASGGSTGYNHKKLGVTAHGAWISAAHHFINRGIDIFKDPLTIVGTGSMRGDVFGNGLLINPNAKLLGAISSKEIFIDPNPDPKIAYEERKRLFEEQKSWDAYDPKKISKGGGVFSRSAKKITLSPQIKKLLGIKKEYLSGEELAKKLLCAKVDLLYIGGIGTYVKASDELNIYIADKANENVRVDAKDLKAYAVCEGGNLGFTQKARIEYAKKGKHINLDSIDNSAGVNTSDYEVNTKIVLNQALDEGKIDEERRVATLKSLTQEVLAKVFDTNYLQPLAITLDAKRSVLLQEEFLKTIDIVEREVEFFKRKDFAIPRPKEMYQVIGADGAIVRPVLGILLSFSKIFLKNFILHSPLGDEPFFEHYLYKYFPKKLYPFFEKEILSHPLRKQIIATIAANIIINNAGATFVSDYDELGDQRFTIKIKAYLLLYTLLGITKVKKELYEQSFMLKEKLFDALLQIEDSVAFAVQWAVRNHEEFNLEPFHILNYKQEIAAFLNLEKDHSDNFMQFIDLIKFIYIAIFIKELKEFKLQEVLALIDAIIKRFKIDAILALIYAITPNNSIQRDLKKQLVNLVEYFVTVSARGVVEFTRSRETLLEGLDNYIKEKNIDTAAIEEALEQAKVSKDLLALTNLIHRLLLKSI